MNSLEETINWLLERDNPSVRFLTLRDILDRKEGDAELEEARRDIANSRIVKKLFSEQRQEGHWGDTASPYHPKYKSTYWQIMVLGHLGIDNTDERVRKACECVFGFQHEEGGFSSSTMETARREYAWHRKRGKALPAYDTWALENVREQQLSCLTGNVCAALIRLGYGKDGRLRRALQWMVEVQNRDGGWLCPYWKVHARDKHGCFYGTICPLEAVSELPRYELTGEMEATAARGAEFMLMHRLFKADHHDLKVINKTWLKLGFPWFSRYNILRGLDVLTKLGYTCEGRLADALDVLRGKKLDDGRWPLEASPMGRMRVNLGKVGAPSKWITYISLRVLKRLDMIL